MHPHRKRQARIDLNNQIALRRRRGGDPTKTLEYKFAEKLTLTADIGPAITFTRGDTVATYFDSSSTLQTATTDEARFDHLLADGTSLGWLQEGASTNEALWNRDFTNVAWAEVDITTAKDATGLDGIANSASTLTATAGNATALQTVTIGSARRMFSIYVKRVTGTGDIDITDNNGSNWTTLTGLSSSAWTRHYITRTQANPVFGIRIVTDTDAVEVDFSQIESGPDGPFPSSAIATTTAAVTRAAEVGTVDDVGWLNQLAGTFYAEYSVPFASDNNHTIWAIDSGSSANYIWLVGNGAEAPVYAMSGEGDITGSVIAAGATVQVALVYEVNDRDMYQDGSSEGTDTTVTLPTGFTRMILNFGPFSGNPLWGHLRLIQYYDVRKPGEFLADITS